MPSIPVSGEDVHREPAAVLSLRGLGVTFVTAQGPLHAVQDVTLAVARGECLGVVGESGAGKSQLFLAVMGLLAANGQASGSARLGDTELIGLSAAALDRVRGAQVGMVFQDPMTSLTPHLTIGEQLIEVLRRHRGLTRGAARIRAQELLERVHMSDPERRLQQYPHALSGGMRQRAMIAIALAAEPQLLIADEPTTSLDVTIQAQILALFAELKRTHALGLVLITHDIAALAGVADRIAVMRAGRVIETGAVGEVLKRPRDPYSRALVQNAAAPRDAELAQPAVAQAGSGAAALSVEGLSVQYSVTRGWLGARVPLTALSAVSLELRAGEALGIVGESGSGKSTLARAVLRLLPASSGRVVWIGRELAALPPRELRALRRDLQIIFQDPLGSLDPRMTVAEIVAEPLRVHQRSLTAAARRRARGDSGRPAPAAVRRARASRRPLPCGQRR